MEFNLKGKVALVTGAGSPIGFGRAIALALAKEGCDVIVNDKDLEGVKQAASDIEALGRQALAYQADVTKSSEVNNMVKAGLDKFGKIDILVNNAGAVPPMKPFVEQDEADWDKSLNLNLKSVMICSKAVLPDMLKRKSGNIVNISSGGAFKCGPLAESYVSAKAGVIVFTKSLGLEVIGSGIRVNCIAPGWAKTNLDRVRLSEEEVERLWNFFLSTTPIGRPTTTEDVANMVVFLVSDASSDVVGQTFRVDGGST
jgi:3-oxoacyl-[acyl-carrier protein] reductase